MNKYTALVSPAANNMDLIRFASFAFPLLSASAIKKALKKKDIKINNQKINESLPLRMGDVVTIYSEIKSAEIPCIYEDENVLLFNKPRGISVESSFDFEYSVTTYAQKNFGFAEPCHRIDNQTCGLILFARNEEALLYIKALFKSRKVEKEYECLVLGTPKAEHALLSAYHRKNAEKAKVYISESEKYGHRPIITEYKVLERGETARLSVILHTGRTHQIRAHLAFIGHPLLGDDLYGNRSANKRYRKDALCLCAKRLKLYTEGKFAYLSKFVFEVSVPF